ncbi:VOC family protein [Streptomyces sp. NPDC057474]|uniref:VOC family protein n=1 Tax=Streptomyces sp. NPDC057474 TaxID=3346144 RepID=UPI0036A9FA5D
MTTRLGSLNEFCWMDLKTRDLPGTAAFFADLLGWHFAVDEEDWRRATKISFGGGRAGGGDGRAAGEGGWGAGRDGRAAGGTGWWLGGVSDLAHPVYPPGTPAHIAYYLAVDDVDRRTGTAVANGARLVVPPFEAGDQGRLATLVDPVGAAVSFWQPHRFGGWRLPPGSTGAPHRMVLACAQPDRARDFYREVTDTDFAHADFTTTGAAPQWELMVGVDGLATVAARVRERDGGQVSWIEDGGRPVLRLSGPEGLTFLVTQLRAR